MSKTISVGSVNASYWSYMSVVMAEWLEQALNARRFDFEPIPKGVYSQAREFFRLAQQASTDAMENPSASISAYITASNAINSAAPSAPDDQELGKSIKVFADFVERLSDPAKMTPNDLQLVKPLREFFLQLYENGEVLNYEDVVASEMPHFRHSR